MHAQRMCIEHVMCTWHGCAEKVCAPTLCVCACVCVLPGERLAGGADPRLGLGSLPEKTRPYGDFCDRKKGWWVWLLGLSPE